MIERQPRVKSDTETSSLSRNGQRHPFYNLSMETQQARASIHLARHSQEVQMNKQNNQSLPSQLEPAALTTTRSWTCPIISWPHSREASKCWRRDCRDLFTTVVVSPWAVLLFHLLVERTRVTIISLYLLPLLHTRHVDHPPILSNFKQILRNSLKKLWKSCL